MRELFVTPDAAAVIMQRVRDTGAVAKAYCLEDSVSWVTLTGVPRELVRSLESLGFDEFPPDPETVDEWIASPRGSALTSMFRHDALPTQKHPWGCRCPECQDCCCCGTNYGQHGGEEHSFVGSGWYAVRNR